MRFLIVVAVVVATVGALPTGWVLPAGNIGYSGILRKDGTYELFSHDFVHDIASIGPTGIVTLSGKNIQFDDNLHRVKRHVIGESGMVTSWGQLIVFKEPYATIVLDGPSAFLLSDGQQIQKPLEQ
ncbi:uncharacterized protein [Panulirus ornatus]|uniref:uncharacterized protein n=1 Tax=Panulirus ornatus TaxID=150431 RepID=UPI003A8617BC